MQLAINGGKPVRIKKFKSYNTIGNEEKTAVNRVLDEGVLSGFMGSWDEKQFFGGKEVRQFENNWSKFIDVKHTITVNSASSGLHIALKACDIKAGDEVIVSPFSMSVSASAPLLWGAKPVFADIDENHYNISPESIKEKITKKTKAIIVVHIFGCPADMDEIMKIAKDYKLCVIEDASQAPGALYKGKNVGSIGDIGIFSLNVHKHIQTGEGGICTTNSDEMALKMQLLRNHAEVVVKDIEREDLSDLIGFNFRLTEIQAAIATEQLKKLQKEIEIRQNYAKQYDDAFTAYPFLESTQLQDRTHSYYIQGFRYYPERTGVPRKVFLDAVRAELTTVEKFEDDGVPIYDGYMRPLYKLPIFDSNECLPIVEEMYNNILFFHDFTKSSLNQNDVNDVISAYKKVCDNIKEL